MPRKRNAIFLLLRKNGIRGSFAGQHSHLKELIHEQFGDGIMSAIDFMMDIEKVHDPNGNRVKVTMCGKFLPYKSW
jgi:cyanate lyase